MLPIDLIEHMLLKVADALGPDHLSQTAFVGGCTTAFLLDADAMSASEVRATYDVDVIVSLLNVGDWYALEQDLTRRGFRHAIDSGIMCRFRLGEIDVDFMPDDTAILGFSNPWYRPALRTAQWVTITPDVSIRMLTPEYFLATKVAAFWGRGTQDPLSSKDLEDILVLLSGRRTLVSELAASDPRLRDHLSDALSQLRALPDFEYALQGNIRHPARQDRVRRVLNSLIAQWDQI